MGSNDVKMGSNEVKRASNDVKKSNKELMRGYNRQKRDNSDDLTETFNIIGYLCKK